MVNFKSLVGDQSIVTNNKNIKVNTPVLTIKIPSVTATKQYFTMYLNKQCAEWLELNNETQKIGFFKDENNNLFIANKKVFEDLGIDPSTHPTINKSLSINDKKLAAEILKYLRNSLDNPVITIPNEKERTLGIFAQYYTREDITFKCLILNFKQKVSDINEGIANGTFTEEIFTYKEEVSTIMDTQLSINFQENNN
jgi:hypothetical protein